MKEKIFNFWTEFKKFISKGNVVDMAVGVAVATAFTAIVNAFTKGFISPLLALLTNNASLADLKIVIREAVMDGDTVVREETAILWGAFVQSVIDFLIIAFALFLFLRIFMMITAKAHKLRDEAIEKIMHDEKAEAEAQAKAEAEAKAKDETEAKVKAEEDRRARELELLEQIAASLKEGK